MSYILDALRKAEAERARGAVPNVHAQQAPEQFADSPAGRKTRTLGWAVGVLAVALAGSLAWRLTDKSADAVPVRDQATSPIDPVIAQAPAPAPAPVSVSAAPEITAPPAPVASPAPAPAPAPTIAVQAARAPLPTPTLIDQPRPAAVRAPANTSAANTTVAAPKPPAQSTPSPAPATAAMLPAPTPASAMPAAPAPAQPPRVYAVADLPADVRGALPQYAVSGSSFSENPAARLLIVNGQVAREGDMLPGGAALEQIKLKTAVLKFKGYRYELVY